MNLTIRWLIQIHLFSFIIWILHKKSFLLQYISWYRLKSKICHLLNPIPTEGGRFGPEQPETGWHFHSFMTGVTKILDFVYFSICLVPVNLFLKKKLWNFEKLKNRNLPFWHQRVPPLEKKSKKLKFLFLFKKIIQFLLESKFYMF